jgi:hypothetical protein
MAAHVAARCSGPVTLFFAPNNLEISCGEGSGVSRMFFTDFLLAFGTQTTS